MVHELLIRPLISIHLFFIINPFDSYKALYDRHAHPDPNDPGSKICFGKKCYFMTTLICASACGAATVLGLVLARLTKQRKFTYLLGSLHTNSISNMFSGWYTKNLFRFFFKVIIRCMLMYVWKRVDKMIGTVWSFACRMNTSMRLHGYHQLVKFIVRQASNLY